jgi:putative transposase
MSATISRVAGRWFVSMTVDTNDNAHLSKIENQDAVGVDLGVSVLAALNRLKRLSRSLSRKVKGSHNRKKARMKLARLYAKITNVRQDRLHKPTTQLTCRFHTIGIEDLYGFL